MKKYHSFLIAALLSGIFLALPASGGSHKQEIEEAKLIFNNRNTSQAFDIFAKHAALGNSEAEAWLGQCYLNGVGTAADYNKAFEYFSKAAAQNDPVGLNGVGICKLSGLGTNVDINAAISCFRKAAEQGDKMAMYNLAMIYADQNSRFYNESLAEEYFQQAVSAGSDYARNLYAVFLIDRRRYTEALPLLQNDRNFDSLLILAECYENGWGVPTDIKKALSLIQKACLLPDRRPFQCDSFYTAGLEDFILTGTYSKFARECFKFGADTFNDTDCQYMYAVTLQLENSPNTLHYMKLAADNGNVEAQLATGKILWENRDFNGAVKYLTHATLALNENVKKSAVEYLAQLYLERKDWQQARHWNSYGASLGITSCKNNLALENYVADNDESIAAAAVQAAYALLEERSPRFYTLIEQNYPRLRQMADQGNSNALFALGMLGCLDGKDHPNFAVGLELLKKSAAQNNAFACFILGNIYRIGELVPKSLTEALSWYRKGAALKNSECAHWVALTLYYLQKNAPINELRIAFEQCIELGVYERVFEYARIMESREKNMEKALELYNLSASKSDSRAMVRLYCLLIEKNPAEAWNHLQQAIELRNDDAALLLGDYYRSQNQPRLAFRMYLQANLFNENNPETAARIAECLLNGYGCVMDSDRFWKFAEHAYKIESKTICLTLGNVYRDGKFCAKNIAKARAYYTDGVRRGDQRCQQALDALK